MDCPKCKGKEAKQVPLVTGVTYLCTNVVCPYYDQDYMMQRFADEFEKAIEDSSEDLLAFDLDELDELDAR